MLGDYDSRLARSERDRIARYREQVELFRQIANMATRPDVRARLLELAEHTSTLWMNWPARRREDPEARRPAALALSPATASRSWRPAGDLEVSHRTRSDKHMLV